MKNKAVIFTIVLCCCFSQLVYSQTVKNGIVDLRHYNFEKEGPVELNGNWDFFFSEFVDPLNPNYNKQTFPQKVYVPQRKVNLFNVTKNIPILGYGTYRIKIILSKKHLENKTLFSVMVPSILSSYKMWINKTEVLQKGVLSKTLGEYRPQLSPGKADFVPRTDTTILTIHYQNETFPSTVGIIIPISFGYKKDIVINEKKREYFYLSCAIFCYTISFYYILLMFLGKEKKVSLLGIALCFTLGTRYLVDEAYLITNIIPNFDAELLIKLSLTGITFFGFIAAIGRVYFPKEITRKTIRIILSIYAIYLLWLFIFPNRISGLATPIILLFSFALTAFLIIKIYPAVKKKKEAASFFMGVLVFTLIIVPLNYFVLKEYIPLAGITHIILFTALITKKQSIAQNRVVALSNDLKLINENLENTVEERTKELAIANNSLQKLNFAKDRFIGILSHDLRNPLNYLVGIADRLIQSVKKNNHEQIIDYSQMVKECASNGYNLAENLLDWSLIQTGTKGMIKEKIEIKSFAEKVIEFHRGELSLKNINVFNKIVNEYFVYVDERMLSSVFRNLLSNAIKFTDYGGVIKILSEIEEDYYIVKIEDNGVGISEENLNNLFRIDKKTNTYGTQDEVGAGFGLIITKELVEYIGGEIEIKSQEGLGTVVSFSIPILIKEKNED